MLNPIAALILDESKWLTASMGLAILAVALLFLRHRLSNLPTRRLALAAMNLFFGMTLGTMALGHLLAVTVKLLLGSLAGSAPAFYTIGIALAAPSWWLVLHTRRVLSDDDTHGRQTLALNTWLAITLLVMGVHNLPLAAPAVFNIGYQLHSRPAVGRVILGLAVIANIGLFIGSLVFLVQGQSFEEFKGLP